RSGSSPPPGASTASAPPSTTAHWMLRTYGTYSKPSAAMHRAIASSWSRDSRWYYAGSNRFAPGTPVTYSASGEAGGPSTTVVGGGSSDADDGSCASSVAASAGSASGAV